MSTGTVRPGALRAGRTGPRALFPRDSDPSFLPRRARAAPGLRAAPLWLPLTRARPPPHPSTRRDESAPSRGRPPRAARPRSRPRGCSPAAALVLRRPEILRDRLNVRPKRLDKGAVRRLRRKHDPRKQHHPKGRQARDLRHIQTRRARPREILGRTNCLLRRFHVGCNLPYELVLARERSFVPQSLPQLQAQILAVEVALVVEEECLDAALGATVMRVHTDGGGGAAPQGGACVDPMRRHEQAWLHGDVGSREAERAPALVPGHHDPFYFGRPAEEGGRPHNVARPQELPHAARRHPFDLGDDLYVEPEPPEELQVPPAGLPEAETLRGHNDAGPKGLEHGAHELLGLQARELRGELEHEQLVRPAVADQLDAPRERADELDVIAEHPARMRVERDHRRTEPGGPDRFDRGAMAPVDAVEGTDRNRALRRPQLCRASNGGRHTASSGRSRMPGTGEGSSQRTPARAPTVVIQRAGRRPSVAPSPPPASAPSGRIP